MRTVEIPSIESSIENLPIENLPIEELSVEELSVEESRDG
jgi:hypothetical protein